MHEKPPLSLSIAKLIACKVKLWWESWSFFRACVQETTLQKTAKRFIIERSLTTKLVQSICSPSILSYFDKFFSSFAVSFILFYKMIPPFLDGPSISTKRAFTVSIAVHFSMWYVRIGLTEDVLVNTIKFHFISGKKKLPRLW